MGLPQLLSPAPGLLLQRGPLCSGVPWPWGSCSRVTDSPGHCCLSLLPRAPLLRYPIPSRSGPEGSVAVLGDPALGRSHSLLPFLSSLTHHVCLPGSAFARVFPCLCRVLK